MDRAGRHLAGERGEPRDYRPRLPGGQRPVRRGRGLAQGTGSEADPRSAPGRQGSDRTRQEGAQERRHERSRSRLTVDQKNREGKTIMAKINRRTVLAASAAAALVPSSLCAQAWPTKSIRWVVPYTAGGLTDSVTR